MAKLVMGKYLLVFCHLFQVEGCSPFSHHKYTYIHRKFYLLLERENEDHMK